MIIVQPSGSVIVTPAPPGTPEEPPWEPMPPVERQAYQVTLTGVDGSVWDLNAGPVGLCNGSKLFSAPPVEHWNSVRPTVAGSRWTGMRVPAVDRVLAIKIEGTDWESWRSLDRAFFDAVDPRGEAQLTVTAPDAESFTQGIRFVDDGGAEDEFDPLLFSRSFYVMAFQAAWPYWRGEDVYVPIAFDPPTPRFPGPPYTINPVTRTQRKTITNRGNVESWPMYVVTGPALSYTVGIGENVVKSSDSLTAGEQVFVDTSPDARSITDADGNRINERMTEVAFAPIPPGADVALNVDITGFGPGSMVEVTMPTWFRRPV